MNKQARFMAYLSRTLVRRGIELCATVCDFEVNRTEMASQQQANSQLVSTTVESPRDTGHISRPYELSSGKDC
jgi:hypothetical protein